MKNKLTYSLFITLLIFGCSKNKELPYYNTPDFTPLWLSSKDEINGQHTISDFSFKDQDGNIVTSEELKEKIYAANFFFTTCPSICPKMTDNLLKVQNAFKNNSDVKLVSFSVMPWMDSMSVLKAYEKKFGIKNGMWYLLTGKIPEIYSLARKSYFAEEEPGYNKDSTQFLHTEHVLLVDKKGHLRGVYNGTLPLEIERLIEDVNILKTEN